MSHVSKALPWVLCVCIHVRVYIHVLCVCLCVHVHVEALSLSNLIFLGQGFSLGWLHWQVNKPWGPTCLHRSSTQTHPPARVTDTSHHILILLVWGLGIQTQVLMFVKEALYQLNYFPRPLALTSREKVSGSPAWPQILCWQGRSWDSDPLACVS